MRIQLDERDYHSHTSALAHEVDALQNMFCRVCFTSRRIVGTSNQFDLIIQEATDIYKRILLEHKDYAALNIFIALCYSRLDYYDISQEILKV